jgi:hypothetical protein
LPHIAEGLHEDCLLVDLQCIIHLCLHLVVAKRMHR